MEPDEILSELCEDGDSAARQRYQCGLTMALDDPDPAARLRVIRSMGLTGGLLSVGPLCRALEDPDLRCATAAAESLSRIGDHFAIQPLIQALATREHMQTPVSNALARFRSPQAVLDLCAELKHVDPVLRANLARVLGRIGDMRALDGLIDCSIDVHVQVRDAAADALVRLAKRAPDDMLQLLHRRLAVLRMRGGADARAFWIVQRRLEDAATNQRVLPIPAGAPEESPDSLPIAFPLDALGISRLPVPAEEP